MGLPLTKRAVGIFAKIEDAVAALTELKTAGFPIEKISVISRNTEEDREIANLVKSTESGNQAEENTATGAFTGGALGTVAGLLVGLGILAIPGIGPIMLAGAEATALATTLAGSAIGTAAGSFMGAFVGLGIPEAQAKSYYERVSRGAYLVMAEGTEEEIAIAQNILTERQIEDLIIYDAQRKQISDLPSDTWMGM
ncbi:hypothetical protein [Microcoleus sp. FACHB-68]|uniref:hypothetical protein n=1 Tax=Microcoleus sp. FACHB-68 TaxID=2692826 RepID=UPI001683973E|nr:hypothetical protein [Microcoleus sp. FACHB-68]MBD1938464.1 hypothetical protein [Microcoleus sp. FACHB-68]